MQAKLRYSAVLAFLTLACIIYLVAKHASAPQHRKARRSYMGSKLGPPESLGSSNNVLLASPSHSRAFNSSLCTMASCFDFSLCEGRPFRLYVYPLEEAVLITFKTHSKSIKQCKNTFPSCHLMWLLRVNSFSGVSFYWTHLPHTSWVGQKLPLLKTFATCKKQDLKMIFLTKYDILHSTPLMMIFLIEGASLLLLHEDSCRPARVSVNIFAFHLSKIMFIPGHNFATSWINIKVLNVLTKV